MGPLTLSHIHTYNCMSYPLYGPLWNLYPVGPLNCLIFIPVTVCHIPFMGISGRCTQWGPLHRLISIPVTMSYPLYGAYLEGVPTGDPYCLIFIPVTMSYPLYGPLWKVYPVGPLTLLRENVSDQVTKTFGLVVRALIWNAGGARIAP